MGRQLPTVTAVTPAYQAATFIREALSSALHQDYPADLLDLVVVDDGSTDETAAEVDALAAQHPGRITLIRQSNAGNVAATNRALREARGEIVALLDADDVWAPLHLRHSVDVLLADPEVGLVYGDMTVIDEHGAVLQRSWLANDVTPQGRCVGQLLAGNNVTGSSIVLRASLLEEIAPIPEELAWADWYLAIAAAQRSTLAYLPEPRTLYRAHAGNVSLGTVGRGRRRELIRAAAFQRWAFAQLKPGDATQSELSDAYAALERNMAQALELGAAAREVASISDRDRAAARVLLARAGAAAAQGDVDAMLVALLQATAANPWQARARDALATALEHLPDCAVPSGQDPLRGARAIIVLVHAEDLLDDPSILGSHARCAAGRDDLTLVIDATDLDPDAATQALTALVEQVGVSEDVDLLASTGVLTPLGRARLELGVHAVLVAEPVEALAA